MPIPANSTEYVCDKGRKFYVRLIDSGASAWLILPEREVSLAKVASANGRYSNGITTLEIDGTNATLDDGPANLFKGCKVPGKEEPAKKEDPAKEAPAKEAPAK